MLAFIHSSLCFILPILSMCQTGAVGTSIKYANCGPANVIQDVDLSPCPTQPCVFHKGENVSVRVKFTSSAASITHITAKVYGIIGSVPIPYPLPKADGCNNCNLSCPVPPGNHVYLNTLPVLQSYPEIKLSVKWELVNEIGAQILCFVFPMSIVN